MGPSCRDAEARLGKLKGLARENRLFDVKQECKVTLGEFAHRFLEWSEQNKRSASRDARLVKNLLAHFDPLNLEKITPAEVERYKSRRLWGDLRFGRRMTTKKGELRDPSKVASGSTVNRELGALRRVLNLAVEWGVLEAIPLAGKLKMLPEAKGRVCSNRRPALGEYPQSLGERVPEGEAGRFEIP